MKKTLTLALASLIFVSAYAQTPYFPIKEGQTLTFAEKNPKGKIASYSSTTITKVDGTLSDCTISYESMVMDAKKKPLLSAPMEMSIQIVDGTVQFSPSSLAGKLSEGMEITGDSFLLPANAAVGDIFDDYSITIAIGPIKTTSAFSNIKVEAKETLQVSGQDIPCLVVSSANATRVFGMNRQGIQKIWYAQGLGNVKTETYDKDGKLVQTLELVEIK